MKATNSKKIIPGQELKQIKHKKKITKIKLGENGEIFFKQVEAKRSKQ